MLAEHRDGDDKEESGLEVGLENDNSQMGIGYKVSLSICGLLPHFMTPLMLRH